GGHILMFVDPLAEADQAGADPQNPIAAMTANKASDPGPLLKAWGVEFNPGQVIADAGHALQVGMRPGDAPVRHLGILGLVQSSVSSKDVVGAGLSNVTGATSGPLRSVEGAQTTSGPLLRTREEAAPLPLERF